MDRKFTLNFLLIYGVLPVYPHSTLSDTGLRKNKESCDASYWSNCATIDASSPRTSRGSLAPQVFFLINILAPQVISPLT